MKFRPRSSPLTPQQLAQMPLPERLLTLRGEDPHRPLEMKEMLSPIDLMGVREAATIIAKTIERGGRIVIAADYDADGATACAIAVRGLRMFGADVDYVVPNRFTDGYGLTAAVVDRALSLQPALIVTVDNGIAAHDGIRHAQAQGVPVVITDHHLAGDTLPPAAAIVNPNQPGCTFPSKHLAGCGVMFYTLIALRRFYASCNDPRGNAPLQNLLDLVALGTVADVVRLDRNNRLLVQSGLQRIRRQQACAGIAALLNVAGRAPADVGAQDMGFYVGPRINAAGRMDDASVGIQCLLADDPEMAEQLALELDATNRQRREVQDDIQADAEALIAGMTVDVQSDYTLIVADPTWHEGVIGIVAGRLKETYQRPTIVFTASEEGLLKGSGRSIPSLHLRDALDAVDRKLPGVIVKFGGHAMAAGLTIRTDGLDAFHEAFEATVRGMLSPEDLDNVVEHDYALQRADLTLENARWMRQGVWGQGFPAPGFLTPAKILSRRILKDKHTKFVLDVDGVKLDAILFNEVFEAGPEILAYGQLDINEWRGQENLQLLLQAAVPA